MRRMLILLVVTLLILVTGCATPELKTPSNYKVGYSFSRYAGPARESEGERSTFEFRGDAVSISFGNSSSPSCYGTLVNGCWNTLCNQTIQYVETGVENVIVSRVECDDTVYDYTAVIDRITEHAQAYDKIGMLKQLKSREDCPSRDRLDQGVCFEDGFLKNATIFPGKRIDEWSIEIYT